ncbi:hypothetical protein CONPUDRAFT_141567 [Coniophora puteana RWD-64-598 SS2]|uniref:Uncharacterized protein n=1 Tax=Coniophora puteana (strain RWD-64-598) TaxID=741705 RepID=A0A5M3N0S6_CONPW|nr:uncharacterized protein CONPUDRAFT_141567 [Coniophora puteana RWD-64-598 SS2]EIW84624.1 hypothetical protein CONPUDRAFT_141567 [Coniophora puteana RWD-64-598 SS2]
MSSTAAVSVVQNVESFMLSSFFNTGLTFIVSLFTLVLYDYALNVPLETKRRPGMAFTYGIVSSRIIVLGQTFAQLEFDKLRYFGLIFSAHNLRTGLCFLASDVRLAAFKGTFEGSTMVISSRCFFVGALTTALEAVIVFFVQAMMALRVCALLGRPRKVIVILSVAFALVQAGNLTQAVIMVTSGSQIASNSLSAEIRLQGIDACLYSYTPADKLSTVVVYGMLAVFEAIMFAFVAYYVMSNLSAPFWRHPATSVASLASIIVRDNLIWFVVYVPSLVSERLVSQAVRIVLS